MCLLVEFSVTQHVHFLQPPTRYECGLHYFCIFQRNPLQNPEQLNSPIPAYGFVWHWGTPLCKLMALFYLIGGLEHFLFFHILGIIIPTDFHIFQRGRYTTNQLLYTINININVNHHVSSLNGHDSWPFALLPLSGAGNESIFGGAGRPTASLGGWPWSHFHRFFFQDSYHGIDDYSPYTSIYIHVYPCFDHGTYEDSWKVSLENSWIFLDMIDPILWPHLDETAGKMQQNTAFKQSPPSCASYERWQDSKNMVSSIK